VDGTDEAPGWDAIDRALRSIYADVEPTHWGTLFRWRLGGPDPLDGVSAYPRMDPVPHWHYVGYGMSDLYAKESDDPEESGWGFELTFRLARDPADTEAPIWGAQFLQSLGKYVFGAGQGFAAGDVVDVTAPIRYERPDSLIRALAFTADPELGEISTPHGRVRFLQAVGLTGDEFAAAEEWDTTALLDVLAPRLPLFVTDIDRGSLLDDPDIAAAVRAGSTRDGSSTDVVRLESVTFTQEDDAARLHLSVEDAPRVAGVLAARLPYGRGLLVSTWDRAVEILPGDRCTVTPGADLVEITVPPDAVDALLDILRAAEGVHSSPSLPGVTIELEAATDIPEPDDVDAQFTDPPGDEVLGLVEPDLGEGVAADSGGRDGNWAVDLFYGDPLSLSGPFVWVRTARNADNPERALPLMLRSEHLRLVEHAWLGDREPAVEPEPAEARLVVGARELTAGALIEGELLWVMQTPLDDSKVVTVIGRGVDIGRIRLAPVGDLLPYQQRQDELYDRLSAALHDRPEPPNPALAGDPLAALRAVTDALSPYSFDDMLAGNVDWNAEPMSPPPPNRQTLTALHGVTITRDYEQAVRELQRAHDLDRETAELFVNRATEHVDFLNQLFDEDAGLRERAREETLRFYALDLAVSSQRAQLAWMEWRDHHFDLPELEDIRAYDEREQELQDAWRAEWEAWAAVTAR
jgi:suppressor of fused